MDLCILRPGGILSGFMFFWVGVSLQVMVSKGRALWPPEAYL